MGRDGAAGLEAIRSAGGSPALRAAIDRAAPGIDPAETLSLLSDPVRGPGLITRLIDQIEVMETASLQDAGRLETIPWKRAHVRALAAGRGPLRIWIPACGSGVEAYALALLACQALGTDSPPIRLLGTDVSATTLREAEEGTYREGSLRGLDPKLRRAHFAEREGRFTASDSLRRLVTFEAHDLARDPIPPPGESPFELIFCRNVLIHFDAAAAMRVVKSLERAVRPGGMLLLGAADALCVTVARTPAIAAAAAAGEGARARLRTLGADSSDPPGVDPLDAEGHFLHAVAELEAGNAHGAVESLRGALCVLSDFNPGAFKPGPAYEALGDRAAARRAYEQAQRPRNHTRKTDRRQVEELDVGEFAAACRSRVFLLGGAR